METADQETDLATAQHLGAEIKNDSNPTVSSNPAPEDVLLTVKSEPDLSPYICTEKLLFEKDSCSLDNPDTELEFSDLKSEIKSEMDTDEQMSLELAESIVNPFQDCITSKVEVDEADEMYDNNADHSVASLNALQEECAQEARGLNHDTEVLTLTEPKESNQEGHVCHVLRYTRKAKPGAREAAEPKTQSDLIKHLCLHCGKSFRNAYGLGVHMRIHNGEGPFICPTCGEAFICEAHMRNHIRKHPGEKPYVCHLCGHAFRRSDSLTDHMRIHTGEKKDIPRRFLCEKCGKRFTKPYMLFWHQQRHLEHRPFTCKRCHMGFKVRQDLQQHQKRHMDVRPYVCKECGHCFRRVYCLMKHQRTHIKQKPYSCPHCPKAYGSRQSLVYHMKCHTN